MGIEFIYPEFEVIRNKEKCTICRICETQCANGVHQFDEKMHAMKCDDSKCVNCQRCVSFCPAKALKIVKSDCTLRENANWNSDTMKEIYKQANSGGVLLSSMGNPKPFPVYWDKLLINASQVTNPSIDPLREPMETKVYLGKKPEKIQRAKDGSLDCALPPLSWESYIIPVRAAFMRIFIVTGKIRSSRLHPAASVFMRNISTPVLLLKSKSARAQSLGSEDICPVQKL